MSERVNAVVLQIADPAPNQDANNVPANLIFSLPDPTTLFNPSLFDCLHTLPANNPQLYVFRIFMSEAYLFKYEAIRNKYEPVYVLCLFPDSLHNDNKLEWAMTIFKLPEDNAQAFGCESVLISDLQKIAPQLIIDCHQRPSKGFFHFLLPTVETSENEDEDELEEGELLSNDETEDDNGANLFDPQRVLQVEDQEEDPERSGFSPFFDSEDAPQFQ